MFVCKFLQFFLINTMSGGKLAESSISFPMIRALAIISESAAAAAASCALLLTTRWRPAKVMLSDMLIINVISHWCIHPAYCYDVYRVMNGILSVAVAANAFVTLAFYNTSTSSRQYRSCRKFVFYTSAPPAITSENHLTTNGRRSENELKSAFIVLDMNCSDAGRVTSSGPAAVKTADISSLLPLYLLHAWHHSQQWRCVT